MERHGFIHDILDVKILVLYVMDQAIYPVDNKKIYELCYQDEGLSYFDLCAALPEMVASGHLEQLADGAYVITEKGREIGRVTEDSIAYPVMQRARSAVERFNRAVRRDNLIHTSISERPGGDFSVVMGMDDGVSSLMKLELMAPTQQQAGRLERAFRLNAEKIYEMVMGVLVPPTPHGDEMIEAESPSSPNDDR